MNVSDIPFIIRDIQKEMPFHSNDTATIPYTFKSLPKKLMEESNKVDNKFLNNHLGEIEEAVDKKLLNKIPFIQQQKKYHAESGILNHDNFFHCDLATGTPISNDNFHHSNFVINPYTDVGCTAGDELETFSSGGVYGNRAANSLACSRSPATDGTVSECYNQIAIDSNNTTGNIHLGCYDDSGTHPDNLQADTGSIPMTADYAFKSVTEFELTTVRTWLCFLKNETSALSEKDVTGGEQVDGSTAYGALPNPSGLTSSPYDTLLRLKTGHT